MLIHKTLEHNDQSGGWNVQDSMIRDVCALSRLWFILAIATLYVSAQGVEVLKSSQRRWVDTHWFRGQRPQAQIVVLRRLEGIRPRVIFVSDGIGLRQH